MEIDEQDYDDAVDDSPPLACRVCGRGTWKEFVFPDGVMVPLCRRDQPRSGSDVIDVREARRKVREDGVD